MAGQRLFWIVVGVLIGAAAAWVRNWWTFAAMVILVVGQLVAAWRVRPGDRPRADDGAIGNPHAGD